MSTTKWPGKTDGQLPNIYNIQYINIYILYIGSFYCWTHPMTRLTVLFARSPTKLIYDIRYGSCLCLYRDNIFGRAIHRQKGKQRKETNKCNQLARDTEAIKFFDFALLFASFTWHEWWTCKPTAPCESFLHNKCMHLIWPNKYIIYIYSKYSRPACIACTQSSLSRAVIVTSPCTTTNDLILVDKKMCNYYLLSAINEPICTIVHQSAEKFPNKQISNGFNAKHFIADNVVPIVGTVEKAGIVDARKDQCLSSIHYFDFNSI